MKAFLPLVALCVLGTSGVAAGFSTLSEIEGVKQVDYDAPFLLVVVQSPSELDLVDDRVRSVLELGEDADAAAIGKGLRLRVVTERQYERVVREKRRVREADTASELWELFETCRFTSVYQLDWARSETVVLRERFVKRYFPPNADELEDEIASVRGFIERLRDRKRRPERLVYMRMPYVGSLVYPVYGDDIRILGTAIPYAEFSKRLAVSSER